MNKKFLELQKKTYQRLTDNFQVDMKWLKSNIEKTKAEQKLLLANAKALITDDEKQWFKKHLNEAKTSIAAFEEASKHLKEKYDSSMKKIKAIDQILKSKDINQTSNSGKEEPPKPI